MLVHVKNYFSAKIGKIFVYNTKNILKCFMEMVNKGLLVLTRVISTVEKQNETVGPDSSLDIGL